MDDQPLKNEINHEPGKAKKEFSILFEDEPSQLKDETEELASATTEPVDGITTIMEKEVGQVWSQHYFNAKVVTHKIQGGFGAKAAR